MSGRLWGLVGLGLVLALVIAVILLTRNEEPRKDGRSASVVDKEPLPTENLMENNKLTCEFEIIPADNGEFGMTFNLRTSDDHPVEVRYFRPYIDFELTAEADDGPVQLVQPAYDVGVQPVDLTIAGMGGEAQITTPIRLRFDPDVAPSGGEVATVWTLKHAPAPVRLRVTMRLDGAEVEPCETKLDPIAKK